MVGGILASWPLGSDALGPGSSWSELAGWGGEHAIDLEILRAEECAIILRHGDEAQRFRVVRLAL